VSETCRIAWNGIPLLTPLTGVGRYTAELLSAMTCLPAASGRCDVFLSRQWRSAESVLQPASEAGGHAAIGNTDRPASAMARSSLWRRFVRAMPGARLAARRLQRYYFDKGISQQGSRYGLYHEPNFIAFPFDGPTVVTVHDLSFLRHPQTHPRERVRFMTDHIESSLQRARVVVAVSDFVRSEIAEVFGTTLGAKTVVVKNGVSAAFAPLNSLQTQSVCQRYGLTHANSDSGFILSVGAQEPRKNLAQLIKAYAQLPQAVKQRFPLILVGPKAWQSQDLEALLTRYRHEPIRWLGYVPQADLPALYAAARAFVYPSLYEGFGLPVLEAMACGTPVIVSDAKALVELVADAGAVVSSHDDKALTTALLTLLRDPEVYESQARRVTARAQRFSWNQAAQDLLGIYSRLV